MASDFSPETRYINHSKKYWQIINHHPKMIAAIARIEEHKLPCHCKGSTSVTLFNEWLKALDRVLPPKASISPSSSIAVLFALWCEAHSQFPAMQDCQARSDVSIVLGYTPMEHIEEAKVLTPHKIKGTSRQHWIKWKSRSTASAARRLNPFCSEYAGVRISIPPITANDHKNRGGFTSSSCTATDDRQTMGRPPLACEEEESMPQSKSEFGPEKQYALERAEGITNAVIRALDTEANKVLQEQILANVRERQEAAEEILLACKDSIILSDGTNLGPHLAELKKRLAEV